MYLSDEPYQQVHKIPQARYKKQPAAFNKPVVAASDTILYELAFHNSLQANIVFIVSSGKILIANNAACKLLGYSKKKLLTKSREAIFDINEKSFRKMLKQRKSDHHSTAFVTVTKNNGKPVLCEITSSVFMDKDGIGKAITTIRDMSPGILKQNDIDAKNEKIVADNIIIAESKQKNIDIKNEKEVADNIADAKSAQAEIDIINQKTVTDNIKIAQAKSDARLEENNEWIKYIAKSSYDVMWDWDITTNEIYMGDSFEEVFGYKVKNNSVKFKTFIKCIPLKDRKAVERRLLITLHSTNKNWNDAYMFKRKDGSIASTISRASIVRDEEGRALRMIGALQDISKLQELEKQLSEQAIIKKDYEEIFQIASKLSYDGIWDWNLSTNDFFLGDGFEELFGKKVTSSLVDWGSHLHPEDKEAVEKSIQEALASSAKQWQHAYRFIKADGSVANVFGRASIIRDAEGKAHRMIGAVHDISKQKVLEERLEQEIKLKEKQIAEATEDAKSTERSNIGKELHDNINQLLGASKMYLEMAKRGGSNSEMYLDRSSEYTLTAINEIRKLTKEMTSDIIKNFGLREAIDNIVHDITEINPLKISYEMKSFKENSVNDKFKLNIYRIVQEQLSNILKHASAKEALITIVQKNNSVTLTISDNGVGFDPLKKRKGIGVDNIKSRATSYSGKAEFVSQPGKGCVLTAKFSIDSYSL